MGERVLKPEVNEWLKSVKLEGDGKVPCSIGIDLQAWGHYFKNYKERIEEISKKCPHVSFSLPTGEPRKKREVVKDKWGCVWLYPENVSDGQVIEHPLKDWDNFKNYKLPDPETYIDWKKEKERIKKEKGEGKLAWGHIEHGFFYLKLTYLRGFENFFLDIGEKRKELDVLINELKRFWLEIIKRWIDSGIDVLSFGDDLGLQNSLPMSPSSWRRHIKPGYVEFFSICRKNNVISSLHTDGYIVDIIPDLIECGVDILNPQDLVNGLGNLEKLCKGKIYIALDIDRQKIIPFGKPEEIEKHIFNCVKILGSPKGGLELGHGVYLGVPIENLEALFLAMEKYYNWWKR